MEQLLIKHKVIKPIKMIITRTQRSTFFSSVTMLLFVWLLLSSDGKKKEGFTNQFQKPKSELLRKAVGLPPSTYNIIEKIDSLYESSDSTLESINDSK